MIAALLAAATVGATPAVASATATAPINCHDAHVMISAMNAGRAAGSPPLSVHLVCQDDHATSINQADPPKQTERTPNFYTQPSYCRSVVENEVARQKTALHGLRSAAQYAVLRQREGCTVPAPVGYHPDLAPGAADPTSKREDAPSNRR
jgi:hypothetical protein